LVRGRLDSIDWAILKELQADGSITNVELARRVGISAPPCLRRVRALEEAGFIKGYRGLLDEKLLGFEVTVFAMVHLSSQAEADLVAFEQFVRKAPPAFYAKDIREVTSLLQSPARSR
jgi:DNA-binding Lrp family transcriptional regulator